jgi:hypothetical protein
MRVIAVLVLALSCVSLSRADTAAYEAAARRVQKVTFGIDKPRMLQAFSASLGQKLSSDDEEVVLGAMESSELEAIYVKNLIKVFSESELIALAEMMESSAYRTYTERMSTFIQALMPEVATHWRKTVPEIQQRIAERRKLSSGGGQ